MIIIDNCVSAYLSSSYLSHDSLFIVYDPHADEMDFPDSDLPRDDPMTPEDSDSDEGS